MFYFGDYEGLRRVKSELAYSTLPNAGMRQGILGVAAVDPYTGTPYPGNQVPPASITPFAAKVLRDLPQPNRAGTGSLGVGNNFESLPRDTMVDDKGDGKLDYYWNEAVTSFFRYSHREANNFVDGAVPGPSGGNNNGNIYAINKSLAGGVTWTVDPTAMIEVRFGYTRTRAGKTPVNFGAEHIEDAYGITGLPKDKRVGGGLNSQSVSGFTAFGRQSSNPQFQHPDVYNPRVNLSKVLRRHTLKFGYEFQAINTEINDLAPVYGSSSYAGAFSRPAGAPANNVYYLADFLVGAQSSYSKSVFEVLQYRQRMNFFYVQDDWKIGPRLTANLGVRYEYATPQWEKNNHLANLDPVSMKLVYASSGGIRERSTLQPDRNNWAPRAGLAFEIDKKTSLRAGYGISYVHFNRMGGENILGFTGSYYFSVTRDQVAPGVANGGMPLCTPGADYTTCFQTTQAGFPANMTDPKYYSTKTSRVNYIPADTPSGYVQSWHLTVQRELRGGFVIDAGYVGNRGAHMLVLGDYNQARPNLAGQSLSLQARRPFQDYSNIQIAFAGGNTFYHSLQTKIERRFSDGLFLMNSFSWAKAIDNAPGHLETYNGDNSRVNFLNLAGERGPSSYDTKFNNVTSLIWDVPVGRGRRFGLGAGGGAGRLAEALLGGWRLPAITNMRTGLPVNITYSPASAFQVCSSCSLRPNVTGPVQNPSGDIADYFLKTNIAVPTDVTQPYGNLGRNAARSPRFYQLDLGINKFFSLPWETAKLELRAELFNALNHTNFRAPNSTASSSSFGVISSAYAAREVQFALKLSY
jgi:hypothetical protein